MTTPWLEDGVIVLPEQCPVEAAEMLLELIQANPGAVVDWSQCRRLHTSVLQVLMVLRPRLTGRPADDFLEHWLQPLLMGTDHPGPTC